jgi:hypothetical protein
MVSNTCYKILIIGFYDFFSIENKSGGEIHARLDCHKEVCSYTRD